MKLALKPNDGETFLKEVDDELRRERVNSFVTRYGWAMVAGAVLFLGAVGGWIWWQGRQSQAHQAEGENLIEALDNLESTDRAARAAAAPKIAALAQSDIEGYRAAALFTRANTQTNAGNAPAAIATLRSIADNQDFDEGYRQAALIRQTALEFDTIAPQEVVRRLRNLARPGSAWIGGAGELVGVAYLKMNRPDLAGPIFVAIARGDDVPETIRARAGHMAASLGYDINAPAAAPSPEPPAAAPARAAPPATPAAAPAPAPATREKAR